MPILRFLLRSDVALYYFLNRKLQNPLVDRLMRAVTYLGETVSGMLLCALAVYLQSKVGTHIGSHAIYVMALSQFLVHALKRIVNRTRPYLKHTWSRAVNPPRCRYSFPSGHTACAVALALVFGFHFAWLKPLVYLLAGLVSLSRIVLGFHYPSDVLVGFLLAYVPFLAVTGLM